MWCGMSQTNVRNWKQFRLIVTEPPRPSLHFEFIKNDLIPFIEKMIIRFWITNYRNPSADYITFRVDVNKEEYKITEQFLNELLDKKKIIKWIPKDWNPKNDARDRIISACEKIKQSGTKISPEFDKIFKTDARIEQLTSLFTDAVGPCAKVLYKALKARPDEPWMMSVFIHLILNSIDMSGPDPPSEEYNIRQMPPF